MSDARLPFEPSPSEPPLSDPVVTDPALSAPAPPLPPGSPGELVGRLLTNHRPIDRREAAAIERIRAEVARLPSPFDRAADPTHVTASAVVVGPRGVLLHRHRRFRRWMQPGGHIDAGETPEVAARREVAEETGLLVRSPDGPVRLLHADVHPTQNGHLHLDLRFLFYGGMEDPAPPPGESPDVAWFSFDGAAALADDALLGALAAALADPALRLSGAPGRESVTDERLITRLIGRFGDRSDSDPQP